MSVDLEAAQVTKYSLQSRYVIPIGDPAVENLTLAGTVIQQELADVDARTMTIGPSITRVWGNWQTVWFVNGVQSTGTVTTSWPGRIDPSDKQCVAAATTGTTCNAGVTIGIPTNDMLVPGVDLASVPKGYLGEPMFEHGFFVEVRGSQGAFGSKANFLQIHIELERAFRISSKWHLLLRDEFGGTAASHFGEMPPAMRFYAGGEGSVRGFEYDGLSPTQKYCLSGSPICAEAQAGGKDVITGTVEFDRDLPRNFGLAFFFDYGNAFNHFGSQEQAVYNNEQQIVDIKEPFLQYGAGIGFLFRLPVLTLGIDIGQPLSQRGSPRLYINFSPKL
jgi:translocation and assembly module TamA